MQINDEIWVSCLSFKDWCVKERWVTFFDEVEQLFGMKLHKFDERDPMKNVVSSNEEAADYLVNWKEKQTSKIVFGRYEKSGILISVTLRRSLDNGFHNYMRCSFSRAFTKKQSTDVFEKFFRLCLTVTEPFNAYSDTESFICSKKPFRKVYDLERELLGMFWLTYFDSHYCEFFDLKSKGIEFSPLGDGALIRAGEEPTEETSQRCLEIEKILGHESFVSCQMYKEPGQFALTRDKLI